MKKLALPIFLSLITTYDCFGADRHSSDLLKAINIAKELKVAHQELANTIAIRNQEAQKLENLDEDTRKEMGNIFSLTNEQAKIRAYALDEKKGRYSNKTELVKFEKELLEPLKENSGINREFFTFKNQKLIGEGHYLLFKVINDKYNDDHNTLSLRKNEHLTSISKLETKIFVKQADLTYALTTFSDSDINKFNKIMATMDSIR